MAYRVEVPDAYFVAKKVECVGVQCGVSHGWYVGKKSDERVELSYTLGVMGNKPTQLNTLVLIVN